MPARWSSDVNGRVPLGRSRAPLEGSFILAVGASGAQTAAQVRRAALRTQMTGACDRRAAARAAELRADQQHIRSLSQQPRLPFRVMPSALREQHSTPQPCAPNGARADPPPPRHRWRRAGGGDDAIYGGLTEVGDAPPPERSPTYTK
eukprot:gene17181-biopygen8914